PGADSMFCPDITVWSLGHTPFSFLPTALLISVLSFLFFFFNDPATTEIYTLSLHDALPIFVFSPWAFGAVRSTALFYLYFGEQRDRKSTRLNSSHQIISYAVFCLKKKNKTQHTNRMD